ncbi:MAG: ATP synthase subunit I [Desulfuromonadaceae bacterium]|nr:ATP synthase subunit I [Desulfuromonadaceae bacterium]MDD2847572.1 ATP synthase subunit I [Desulfuromonadaceae bacterium]MDD4131183.1 ATP synthase subunit I [Desulfuromonadaceae bacterium]
MITINEDNLFAVIIKGSLGLLAFLTLAGWAFFSIQVALGALVGGCIAIANFFWIRNVLQRVLQQAVGKATLYAQVRYIARLSVTGLLLYFVITSSWFSLSAVFIGLSVIVINIIALSLYSALRAGG